ncbi:MAG: EamA family transporter, partial [Phyllobacteriaceae bacterium]|nr:EamA family transporter [Phyllobacteriaceae bacterium]
IARLCGALERLAQLGREVGGDAHAVLQQGGVVARHAIADECAIAASLVSRGALFGLASGAVFGLSAVAYRTASLSIEGPGFLMQASVTLLAAICFQTLALGAYMALRNRAELLAVFRNWRAGAMVGTVGAFTSFLWFAAVTLQQAAVVKALAQIEILFTYAATLFVFRENVTCKEVAGCLLIIAGILALLY